jgi:alpha-tubulin suppressor-like RCC1 family protein
LGERSAVYRLDNEDFRISHLASTDSGQTAAVVARSCDGDNGGDGLPTITILIFSSLDSLFGSLKSQDGQHDDPLVPPGHIRAYRLPEPQVAVRSLLATRTGFVALTVGGNVYTWGDGRFPHALGREVPASRPSAVPSLVDDLTGLNVVKIATGGDLVAAVTEAGDAYVWGMTALGSQGEENRALQSLLKDRANGEYVARIMLPTSNNNGDDSSGLDAEENELGSDIVDVAVGDGHILVLTEVGSVWACGSHEHGQLGLGTDEALTRFRSVNTSWHLVSIFEQMREEEGRKAIRVHAGDLTSLVATSRI